MQGQVADFDATCDSTDRSGVVTYVKRMQQVQILESVHHLALE